MAIADIIMCYLTVHVLHVSPRRENDSLNQSMSVELTKVLLTMLHVTLK